MRDAKRRFGEFHELYRQRVLTNIETWVGEATEERVPLLKLTLREVIRVGRRDHFLLEMFDFQDFQVKHNPN